MVVPVEKEGKETTPWGSKSLPEGSRSLLLAESSFVLSVSLLAAVVIAVIVIRTIIRAGSGAGYQVTIEEVIPHGLSQVTVK